MLYLAEVRKKTGFIANKTELRLLAYQRSDQCWVSLSGEDVIPCEEANAYNSGALVMVTLGAQKQVQKVQEAARQLVTILLQFSRLQEKSKSREEQVEELNQSLMLQLEELRRREEALEAERQALDDRLDEISASGAQGLDRVSVGNLPVVPLSLHGSPFQEEPVGASSQMNGVAVERISGLLRQLVEEVPVQIQVALEGISQQQTCLTHHDQQNEYQMSLAQELQGQYVQQEQAVQMQWQEWHRTQQVLEEERVELMVQHATLQLKEGEVSRVSAQLKVQEELYQYLYHRLYGTSEGEENDKIDVAVLEQMPLSELQGVIQVLRAELAQASQLVLEQEDELRYQNEEIENLKGKMTQVSDFERLSLEADLADEQERYDFLNETLIGQRRTLTERQGVLSQYEAVLLRREGQGAASLPLPEEEMKAIVATLETQRQQLADELLSLEQQVEQLGLALDETRERVEQQTAFQAEKRRELEQLEMGLQEKRLVASQIPLRLQISEELFQPLQESTATTRLALEGIAAVLDRARDGITVEQEN